MMRDLDLLALRANECLLLGPNGQNGDVVVLDQRRGRYLRVAVDAARFLDDLADREWGGTFGELQSAFPTVDIKRLISLDLVDVSPPDGLPIRVSLVVEVAAANITARVRLRARKWGAVRPWIDGTAPTVPIGARPLLYDRLEAATTLALSIPGTSRLCTVVALSLIPVLRRRGHQATIAIASESDQIDPHAFVLVRGHRIDPSDDQIDAPVLRSPARAKAERASQ
jgi:hypothetical protein